MSLPATEVTTHPPALEKTTGAAAWWSPLTLTTKLAIAMILLVAIAISAVSWLSFRSLEQVMLPRMLDRIETYSRFVAVQLEAYVAGARGDVAGYRAAAALEGIIRARVAGGTDPVDKLSEKTWRDRMAAEVEAKPAYAMLRIIGIEDGGREIVRVDRMGPDGAVRIAPDSDLRGKAERDYFKETIRLAPGEIYVSPLNLDRDTGVISTPLMPTLRVASPVFTPDGKPFGIVIVNVDMRPPLARARDSARPSEQTYIVNAVGDYLVHPDVALEFASQLGGAADWRQDFPYFASLAGASQGLAQIVLDKSGLPGGAAIAPALLAGKQWVGIIAAVPNQSLRGLPATIRDTALGVGMIAMLLAGILAVLMAKSLTRPIIQLTAAVETIGTADPGAIPVDASGETGVLARALARAIGEVTAKTAELEREIKEHRRTEAARDLHAARERLFSAAVQSSNDAIVTKSLDGIITGWNPAAERLFGFSAEEAVGHSIKLIVPDECSDELDEILRRVGRGERIEQYETWRRRRDGTPVQVSLSISPIKDASGRIVGASKIARDISEIRKTEQALRQQVEERRRIFETSQDLIMIVDSKGMVVQISPSSEAILGYLPEEMIGRNAADFIYPDELERSRQELREARNGKRIQNCDFRYRHKDGRAVTISWMGGWSEPIQRHIFLGRDMTESRLAQETLRESEQLARNIIETSLDAFVQVDDGAGILNWNSQAERIFGWHRSEVLGKDLIDLVVVGADRDGLRAARERFLSSGQGKLLGGRREIMVRHRDGREFKAELSVTALKQRGGLLFNAFFRDLTDKIAAEERLRQSQKMEAIGQLTGGVAHDFNNILTVITGTIEILSAAVAGEPQLAAITRMIDEAAARGADLTQHLLAFARRQPLQPREIDINTLIIDTAKLLRPTLGEHIEIESVFEDETCRATADPNQLATAIINLALNARDAMPQGGKLILETALVYLDENYAAQHPDVIPGRYALIAIGDSGAGIPAAIRDKVFDPFFTSKGPGKGTGLGLSMVYGFVKQSAGHIQIYSEEGHGTTIKMYLPPGTGAALVSEADVTDEIEVGHETILVVEDDNLVRDYVLTQLHSLGYVTLAAANAAEALAIIEAGHRFDLLFTDAIRRDRADLKVLYTSGYTENAIIHHGRLDSGVLLLPKPYRKSELAKMIRRAIEGQGRSGD
jgi:PAS domain S-box-containing protein